MSNLSGKSWSNSPNAPQIPRSLYLADKENFAGDSIAAILYGIVTVIFFQCMAALFDPVNRTGKRGVKLGLAFHAATMFTILTISIGMGLNLQSISHIDNREFPGNDQLPPGPLGYKLLIYSKAISVIPNFAFLLNQWLADGLLLYRCYIIYAMNYWAISLPCLMYTASLVTGIVYQYRSSIPSAGIVSSSVTENLGVSYFAVSLALNILLTSMIVVRLILHRRNIQNAMGGSVGAGRLYGAIITILVESSALYAVSFLLFFVPAAANSWVQDAFWSSLINVQVIAPFLIIRRVATRSALTSDVIAPRDFSSIHFRGPGESTSGGETLADSNPTNSTGACGEIPCELGAGVEITIDKSAS